MIPCNNEWLSLPPNSIQLSLHVSACTETRSIKVYAECKGIVVLVLLLNQLDKD